MDNVAWYAAAGYELLGELSSRSAARSGGWSARVGDRAVRRSRRSEPLRAATALRWRGERSHAHSELRRPPPAGRSWTSSQRSAGRCSRAARARLAAPRRRASCGGGGVGVAAVELDDQPRLAPEHVGAVAADPRVRLRERQTVALAEQDEVPLEAVGAARELGQVGVGGGAERRACPAGRCRALLQLRSGGAALRTRRARARGAGSRGERSAGGGEQRPRERHDRKPAMQAAIDVGREPRA